MPLEKSVTDLSPYYPGEYKLFASATAIPSTWLVCDGRAVSRTAYPRLYAAIGTLYGVGDGSTTFNLPDPRGRTMVCQGAGAGLTSRVVGNKWGVETVSLSAAQNGAHSHGINANTTQNLGYSNYGLPVSPSPYFQNSVMIYDGSGGIVSVSSGSGASHENCQPSIAVAVAIFAG